MTEVESSNSAKNQCSICIQQATSAIIDNCEHRFCLRCIRKWAKKKDTCPLCRTRFTQIRSNGRTYKVSLLRPSPRHSHSHHQMSGPRVTTTFVMPLMFNNYVTTINFFGSNMTITSSTTLVNGSGSNGSSTSSTVWMPSLYMAPPS